MQLKLVYSLIILLLFFCFYPNPTKSNRLYDRGIPPWQTEIQITKTKNVDGDKCYLVS